LLHADMTRVRFAQLGPSPRPMGPQRAPPQPVRAMLSLGLLYGEPGGSFGVPGAEVKCGQAQPSQRNTRSPGEGDTGNVASGPTDGSTVARWLGGRGTRST